jgi:hypothetical protein
MPLSDSDVQSCLGAARAPLALIPPSLDKLLGRSARSPSVVAALRSLGFSGLLHVADGLPGYYAELSAFARSRGLERLCVTACPAVTALLSASYPEAAALIPAGILPPAERVLKAARLERPGLAIFFLSPCSARARSLERYVDFAIPLSRVLPDILAALGPEEAGPPEGSGEGSCALPAGARRSVAGLDVIRDFLSGKAGQSEGGAALGDPALIEFLACAGGCSEGDWALRGGAAR